eukprot:c13194_g2_i1 orf=3-188(-)
MEDCESMCRLWAAAIPLFLFLACARLEKFAIVNADCLPPDGCETSLAYYQVPRNVTLEDITD